MGALSMDWMDGSALRQHRHLEISLLLEQEMTFGKEANHDHLIPKVKRALVALTDRIGT